MADWELTGQRSVSQDVPTSEAISVSQAVEIAATALDAIPLLTVIGEVTGFRGPNARSGHCYFQIKDDTAAVDCIVWRSTYAKAGVELRNGAMVQFTGSFNLYKPTGRMSFVARSFTLAGEGLLRQQVAALAEKLRREGLMDASLKRPIPAFCTRVAVVTSLSGAVIDDVKRTLRRRNPLVELICVGARVQGEGAPQELIAALERVALLSPAPDCVLLVRGGGSFEDLMTFNDEELARAVRRCPIPVVTGIGHEPDTSICDMVSDRRASTPTAAAESVAPAAAELVEGLSTLQARLQTALRRTIDAECVSLHALQHRAVQAVRSDMDRRAVALAALSERPCLQSPRALVERRRLELEQTTDRLVGSFAQLGSFKRDAQHLAARFARVGQTLTGDAQARLSTYAASLEALSPLKVLSRGYSILSTDHGVVTQASQLQVGDEVEVRMVDGKAYATINALTRDTSEEHPASWE